MYTPKRLRTLVITVLIALLGWLIFALYSHGRIVVDGASATGLRIAKVMSDGTHKQIEAIKSGDLVQSGTYMIQTTIDKKPRVSKVVVGHWLQTSHASFGSSSASLSRVAALTYPIFFSSGNQLVSLENLSSELKGYTLHKPNDAFGGNYSDITLEQSYKLPIISSSGDIIAINENRLIQKTATSPEKTLLTLWRNYAVDNSEQQPVLWRSSDMRSSVVGLYDPENKSVKTIDTVSGKTSEITLNDEAGTTFDVSSKTVSYIVSSPITSSSTLSDEESLQKMSAVTQDVATGKKTTVKLHESRTISALAVDPSGSYLAALEDGYLSVYKISDGKLLFSNPFFPSNQLFWQGGNLYISSVEGGLLVYKSDSQQLVGLGLGEDAGISLSHLTAIGSLFYASGYSAKESSKLPDGYVIDVNKKDDNLTTTLSQNLPYTGSDYDISFLGTTVYVRVNVLSDGTTETNEQIKTITASASRKVSELLNTKIKGKYSVVFVN